jgi:hypothetical protein
MDFFDYINLGYTHFSNSIQFAQNRHVVIKSHFRILKNDNAIRAICLKMGRSYYTCLLF